MFKVIHKDTKVKYVVYDIIYDASGYAHFLIYKDDQWVRVNAKHFEPAKGLF